MYQQSKRMLICLISIHSSFTITCVVLAIIKGSFLNSGELQLWMKVRLHQLMRRTQEEFVLSGNHHCISTGNGIVPIAVSWILGTVWEVLALCLVVWITIKHLRERPTGSTIGDCFTAMIESHVLYFAS
jgi:hypothetical protein